MGSEDPALQVCSPLSAPSSFVSKAHRVCELCGGVGLALDMVAEDMLGKEAIELVVDKPEGFYAQLFLVPKMTGGWRPVFDLSALNTSLRGASGSGPVRDGGTISPVYMHGSL